VSPFWKPPLLVADSTPLAIVKFEPTLIAPNVVFVAVGIVPPILAYVKLALGRYVKAALAVVRYRLKFGVPLILPYVRQAAVI